MNNCFKLFNNMIQNIPYNLRKRIITERTKHLLMPVLKFLFPSSPLKRMKVRNGPAKGAILEAHPYRDVHYWTGVQEPQLQEKIPRLIREGDSVYDVGGAMGYYSILFSKFAGKKGKVYVFEPNPTNIERIESIIKINGSENVKLVKKALYNKETTVNILINKTKADRKELSNSVILKNKTHKKGFTEKKVHTITLDNHWKKHKKIDVIKIDIEGFELEVLQGAKHALKEHPLLILELHTAAKEKSKKLYELLKEAGYTLIMDVSKRRRIRNFKEFDDVHNRKAKSHIVAAKHDTEKGQRIKRLLKKR